MERSVNLQTSTIGEIARLNPDAVLVFRKYGINFYNRGKSLLGEACAAANCNESRVLAELAATVPQDGKNQHYNEWSISSLIEFIVENHHQYVNKTIPEIAALFTEALPVSGAQKNALARAGELFRLLGNDMKQHMQKEELALFPAMKKLEAMKTEGNLDGDARALPLQSQISVIEMEHKTSGLMLSQIGALRELAAQSANPGDNLSLLVNKLKEFEADLVMHIHIENNILHTKTLELMQNLIVSEI